MLRWLYCIYLYLYSKTGWACVAKRR